MSSPAVAMPAPKPFSSRASKSSVPEDVALFRTAGALASLTGPLPYRLGKILRCADIEIAVLWKLHRLHP